MKYRLTDDSIYDLENIFEYTVYEFNYDQAIKYLDSFDAILENLSANPNLGRLRNEIRNELRSITHSKHVIFYRIIENEIIILRILHGSRDLPRYF